MRCMGNATDNATHFRSECRVTAITEVYVLSCFSERYCSALEVKHHTCPVLRCYREGERRSGLFSLLLS